MLDLTLPMFFLDQNTFHKYHATGINKTSSEFPILRGVLPYISYTGYQYIYVPVLSCIGQKWASISATLVSNEVINFDQVMNWLGKIANFAKW